MVDFASMLQGYEVEFKRGAVRHRTQVFCCHHPSYLDRKNDMHLEEKFKRQFFFGANAK